MYAKTCFKCGAPHRGKRICCPSCEAKRSKSWRVANPQKAKASVKKYQINNPSKRKENDRKQSLKRNYGITLKDYDDLLKKQENLCAICKTDKPNGPGKYFMVDHNHENGQVRGLLCCHCNFLLGHAKESVQVLKNVIKYLEGGSCVRKDI